MKVHEYQAKHLLGDAGIPIPAGRPVTGGAEAREFAQSLQGPCVIKAQIHAGGRGKGGGIRRAETPEEAFRLTEEIIGMRLVTPQTGPEGRLVRRVLVEEAQAISAELYLGIVIDRESGRPVVIASAAGGMDIEEVSARTPEKILKESIDPAVGLRPFQGRKLAYGLGLGAALGRDFGRIVEQLYQLMIDLDASLVEVNPLVITGSNHLLALDAKINFDDNALGRHPKIAELRDLDEENALEVQAGQFGLTYISLDGTIGCMVNGAGLAMATMDIIKLAGGEPANFLDVGGGASEESVTAAFRILLGDPKVKAVLINIFGGIVRCDRVARGIMAAVEKLKVELPVVVRLKGTNAEEAAALLAGSKLRFTVAETMAEAAEKAVGAAGGKA